jgi:hypothetical protein
VVPRNRNGDAPVSGDSINGDSKVFTPTEFAVIPVEYGKRPDSMDAWPGAVSVLA